MRRLWIVIALLAGCNGAPSCDDVASDLAHFAPRASRVSIASAIEHTCESDAWSGEARRCLKWVERRSRIHRCGGALSDKQTAWILKQVDPDADDDLSKYEALHDDPPPPPPPPEPPPEHPAITVDVESDGTTSFGGRPIASDELDALFKTTAGMDPESKLTLRVSAATPYKIIVPIMDRAQKAGLPNVAFETK